MRAQFVIVLLGPFGRAQQSGLFSVPRAINDGALGLPSGLDQLPEGPRFFHKGNLARDGILRAVHPPVMMVAANHPLIGKRSALNSSDDVVKRLDFPVRFHFEVNFRGSGAEVISDAKAAAPTFRDYTAGQCSKQGLRVRIRDWQDRDFRDCWGVFDFQALGVFRGPHPRRERIAGIEWHVRDAAALDSIGWPISPGRVSLSLDKTVLVRIGINQEAHRAVLGGNFGLDAAPGVEITRDDNLALHGNAHAIELLVVFGDSVVDIHELSCDVAVDRVRVIGGKLLGLLVRRGVLRKRRFLELGNEFRTAFDELDEPFFRRREENVKLFDMRVEAKLLEFCGDPFGVLFVVGRADVVRVRGETLHVIAEVLRAGNGAELLFPLAFDAGRLGGIAEERLLVGGDVAPERSKRDSRKKNGCNGDGAIHDPPRMRGYSA